MKKLFLSTGAVLVVVAVILFAILRGHSEPPVPGSALTGLDFSAIARTGGTRVLLAMKISRLERVLGRPSSEKGLTAYSGGASPVTELDYPSLNIVYENAGKTVIAIELLDRTYMTARGLTVGASEPAVIREYGTPAYRTDATLSYLLTNSNGLEQRELVFTVTDGMVKTIWIAVPTP